MRQYVLVGGGNIGRGDTSYETKEIDQEIVHMTHKKNPNFLFVGLASSHSDSYYDTIKKIYQRLGCVTTYLKRKNLLYNPDLVLQKIQNADIIYIGGGDTLKLLEDVNQFQLASLFFVAADRGCVLVGVSAGAILLAREGFSDSYILRNEGEHYQFISGLQFVPISICPHFHHNLLKDQDLIKSLCEHNREVYGLENCTALKIVGDDISVLKCHSSQKVWLCSYEKTYQEMEFLS